MQWLIPWYAIRDTSVQQALLRELSSELCPRHELYGINTKAIAQRHDCDDFLFELLDGSGRLAVVHLTFARRPEPDPLWPATGIYANWKEFECERMGPDAAEWAV